MRAQGAWQTKTAVLRPPWAGHLGDRRASPAPSAVHVLRGRTLLAGDDARERGAGGPRLERRPASALRAEESGARRRRAARAVLLRARRRAAPPERGAARRPAVPFDRAWA